MVEIVYTVEIVYIVYTAAMHPCSRGEIRRFRGTERDFASAVSAPDIVKWHRVSTIDIRNGAY